MYITQCLWSLKINSLGSVTACRNEVQQPKLSLILPPERHLLNSNRHLVNLPSSRLQISFWGDRNITTAQNKASKIIKYIFKHVFIWRDLKRFHSTKNWFHSVVEFSVCMHTQHTSLLRGHIPAPMTPILIQPTPPDLHFQIVLFSSVNYFELLKKENS